ncbi:hypothetical protein [Dolichospermum compactum]|uniref:Uncharacterized protein n=1 Tax=Dolichospermum compactum NIES-806 TaxID=1973481 RepID=A0A1Z4VA30_9CYAN|nr:hypothetical protein [Dolichospermum compactum]BAZ88253.1 hypothetical protein NIES806_44890 [Dolichospermum compactum NIES-806]
MRNKTFAASLSAAGIALYTAIAFFGFSYNLKAQADQQAKNQFNRNVARYCQNALLEAGRRSLWLGIYRSAAGGAGNDNSEGYFQGVFNHCEWNLKGEKQFWSQIVNNALSNTAIPEQNQQYYRKRIAEHCEWLLNNGTGDNQHKEWWNGIQASALGDAGGNTGSDYYYKRVGEHCEWLIMNSGRPDLWNGIRSSARGDAIYK